MDKVAYLIVNNLRSTQEHVALQEIVASQNLHVEIRGGSLPEVHSQRFTPRGSLPEFHSQRFTP